MREKKGSDLLYQQGHSTFASGTKLEVFQDQLFLIMCYSDANECNQEAVTVIIPTMTEIFLKILKGFQVMLKLWDFFFFFFLEYFSRKTPYCFINTSKISHLTFLHAF